MTQCVISLISGFLSGHLGQMQLPLMKTMWVRLKVLKRWGGNNLNIVEWTKCLKLLLSVQSVVQLFYIIVTQ